MINFAKDIRPLTDFKTNTNRFIADLKKTKRPTILTVNGKAVVAVMDVSVLQEMQDEFEFQKGLKKYDEENFLDSNEETSRLKRKNHGSKKRRKNP